MIYHIQQTTSTNDEARNARYRHGDVVWAEWQSAGRGQRGHSWLCPEGLNVTYSAILEPTFLPATEQFLFTEVAALSVVDTLGEYGIEAADLAAALLVGKLLHVGEGSRKLQHHAEEHECHQNPRRGHLCLVDEELPEGAQSAAHSKHLEIVEKDFHFSPAAAKQWDFDLNRSPFFVKVF